LRLNNAVFILLLLVISSSAFAQKTVETTIAIGGNVSLFKLQDTGMSSVQYNGIIPGVHLRLERVKANSISTFTFNGEKGILNAKGRRDGKVSKVNQDGFDVKYSYLRKVSSDSTQWRIYVGLQVGSMFRYRIHNKLANSARLYDNINYIAPSITGRRSVELFGLPLTLNANLSIPVFAAVVRPSITNLSDFLGRDDDELKSRFEEHGFTSFKNLLMLQSEVSVSYRLKNSDAINIHYNWQFIDYNRPNQMQSANQMLGVSYVKLLGGK
jgi:hypothetical protein